MELMLENTVQGSPIKTLAIWTTGSEFLAFSKLNFTCFSRGRFLKICSILLIKIRR